MVTKESTVSPDTYRVDVVPGDQGSTYRVVRCVAVAQFEDEEHAAFLVELLAKGAGS